MDARPTPIGNRAGYDLWASAYDRYPNPTVAMDERHFPRRWAHLRGLRVLEIGCGTGRHTVKLAGQGNRVTGMDLSPGMLLIARQKVAAFPDVVLVEGDFLAGRAVCQGPFDTLVAALVLEHLRDLPAFFAKARGLLAPGAELHVSEIHPARTAAGILAHFKTADGRQFDLDSVPHAEGAIEAAAAAAGFRLRDTEDAGGDAQLAAINPKWARYEGLPMIRMWCWLAVGS
jgi:SAM-dependent methyltransferase